MAEKLIHIFKEFLGILFPQKCLGCGTKNVILCDKCLNSLPFPEDRPWNLQGRSSGLIFSATSYQDEIVKKAIRLLKYHGIKILAEPFSDLIFKRIVMTLPEFMRDMNKTLIIPIPLSKKRHRERGFNQTELIGRFLSDKMSIRMANNVLYKIKETISQVEIKDREKRLKNLEGAFEVKNAEIIKNKNIILIDDITTTGATLSEARRILKDAGAKKIIGLVVAKG
ncbi:MAG: phosphoribosyltransferase family protein [Candidatus Tagabacteria bacterium]